MENKLILGRVRERKIEREREGWGATEAEIGKERVTKLIESEMIKADR